MMDISAVFVSTMLGDVESERMRSMNIRKMMIQNPMMPSKPA